MSKGFSELLNSIDMITSIRSLNSTIRLGDKKYVLEVDSKFNIVIDHSSTGKSLLWDIVRNKKRNRAIINSDWNIVAIDTLSELDTISKSIILIDEECLILESLDELKKSLKSDNNVYIIIQREEVGFADIPYSVSSIKY